MVSQNCHNMTAMNFCEITLLFIRLLMLSRTEVPTLSETRVFRLRRIFIK